MNDHDQNLRALRASGYRVTSQRQLVLEVVENSPEHLDAEAATSAPGKKTPISACPPSTSPWRLSKIWG